MNYYIKSLFHSTHCKSLYVLLLVLPLLCYIRTAEAQTDFAPGEIMFTGYASDPAAGPVAPFGAFSIVLLRDVVSGTVIYVTDRGWSNTTGFRNDATLEGTISFTFTANFFCGDELIFSDNNGATDWQAKDEAGNVTGTVVIQAGGDADGMVLGTSGDQLIIYQLPEPTDSTQETFVAMIQMDNNYSSPVNTDDESEIPGGLSANDVVRFATEFDNAKYDCTPNAGQPQGLQNAISNDDGLGGLKAAASDNWNTSDTFLSLTTTCSFCCGAGSPPLSAPNEVTTSQVFTISITGNLPPGAVWELYGTSCGSGLLQTSMLNSFVVTAPASTGNVTYWVRPSTDPSCTNSCTSISICVVADLLSLCTNCAGSLTACGTCFLPAPVVNPPMDSGCYALKLIFILDESGSIGGNAVDVKNGVLAFLNALNGQNAEAAIIEFSDLGRIVNDYTVIDDDYIGNITNYFNGIPNPTLPYHNQVYAVGGGTNWHDAMKKAQAMPLADLILFFTDGVATSYTNAANASDVCGNGATTQTPEIVNPVKIANYLKGLGTHMFMLGVGAGVNILDLQRMSGFTPYQHGFNTIATSDYSVGNFTTLAEDLQNFVLELCRSEIIVIKDIIGPRCNGRINFRFRIINTGSSSCATGVVMRDTLAPGFSDPIYTGPETKFCVGSGCLPEVQPPNAFRWVPISVCPGDTATLIVSVHVEPTGPYTNVAWVVTNNAGGGVDTFAGAIPPESTPPSITCPPNISIQCSSSTLPATTGSATGFDPEGDPVTFTYLDVYSDGPCPQSPIISRIWKVTDGCGAATCIQTITLSDTNPPTLTCPPNVTVNCAASTSPANTGTATATDLCDPAPTTSHTDVIVAGICAAEYTVRRTWSSTDHCGNVGTCLQTIFVDDNTGPVVTCTDIQIPCEQSIDPSNTGYPTVTNDCGGTSTSTYSDVFVYQMTSPPCSIHRTWTATDACGNSGTCLQTITVKDITIPSIYCPANITITCSASTLPGTTGAATATDNCSISPSIAYTDMITASGTCERNYSISRTWKATDECGNTAFCIQGITIVDAAAPVLSCPANVTISCTASTLPATTGTATATDNCSTFVISSTDVVTAGACPQESFITRQWKATDACGNISTCNQIITVRDQSPPSITCPVNVTIQCTANTLPAATGTATATDNCSTFAITSTDVIVTGSCPQQKTITRTWKATDACGNFSTCNQVITIIDTNPPVVTCPVNVTIDCAASTLPANTGNASATDNCSTFAITSTDVIVTGICPQEKVITRTWKATDACGNFSTCNQVITIHDTTAPSISCPANVTIQCTASTLPVNTGTATASDNCSTFGITFTDVIAAGGCPQAYTITRTWKATDACTNFNTCNQTITIIDSTPPVITCPSNVTIACTASTLPASTGTASAVDNCSTFGITSTDVILSGDCPQEKTIIRTWRATDACGNISSCNQTITVEDIVNPFITCPPNITIECTASTLPANTGNASATDNCSTLVISSTDAIIAGACPQESTIIRTWKATDACGNSATCNQIIFRDDSTPPLITCPSDATVQCTGSIQPAQTGIATATDNCDAAPIVTYNDVTANGPTLHGYSISRTWTSSDACGNVSTCLQHIIVANPLDPSITGSPTDTICSGSTEVFQAQNQGFGSVTYQWNFGSGSSPSTASGIGPHTVTYTYNGTNGTVGAWVLLTVSFPGCASVTDTVANIHVNAIPDATILAPPPGNPCVLGPVSFQPQSPQVPGFTYSWDFGSGASVPTGNGYGPHTIEYFSPGDKTIKLIVHSNEAGESCSDTSTIMITVDNCPGSISGKVLKSDGTPILNANVRLYADSNPLDGVQDNGTIIKNAFTNVNGDWIMVNVTPGYYVLFSVQPNGFFSLSDADTSEDFDSLANFNPNDNIIPVTLEPDEDDADNIFVKVSSPVIISGYVFQDFDNNQSPGQAEGIQNVTVQLYRDNDQNGVADIGGFVTSTTTSSAGFYTFGGLSTGSYVLTQVLPSGFTLQRDFDSTNDGDVVPNTNQMDGVIPVTLISNETDANNYFIDYQTCPQVVTNTNDNGPGSLRYAISCSPPGSTISFHPVLQNQTIHINTTRIDITGNLNISSGLTPRIKIQSDIPGMFRIGAGVNVDFQNLDIISGLNGFSGAAFENFGNLLLWDVSVKRNPLLPPGNALIHNAGAGVMNIKGGISIDNQ